MELSTTTITKGRRYIYDGSRVVAERLLEASDGGSTTLADGHSRLERIYVVGSILFSAIDYNRDGDIADDLNTFDEECLWLGGLETIGCSDAAFYYYTDASGRVAALGHKNNDRKILEYYRYRSYGEVTVLTLLDDGTSPGTASDGIEDTPSDLGDNPTRRISKFANPLTFTGRRLDDATGKIQYREREQNTTLGVFLARDPMFLRNPKSSYRLFGTTGNQNLGTIGKALGSSCNTCQSGTLGGEPIGFTMQYSYRGFDSRRLGTATLSSTPIYASDWYIYADGSPGVYSDPYGLTPLAACGAGALLGAAAALIEAAWDCWWQKDNTYDMIACTICKVVAGAIQGCIIAGLTGLLSGVSAGAIAGIAAGIASCLCEWLFDRKAPADEKSVAEYLKRCAISVGVYTAFGTVGGTARGALGDRARVHADSGFVKAADSLIEALASAASTLWNTVARAF